ncbi:MAG: DegT/DnrJ/EryC1/StrS family aminotransferase [Bacteroidetes bacterium]|nr:DegT/DnrJ/EryC1/StrS family aminotransferase [Bacteroidota bacterium]MCB0842484.1 DegT/DnrJ/EryC1/StrS family aminotransferase [Bacteroidota bacterium]MCB0852403.1 DegT/DnrJ/EryC1/StrS family aminotransferase [Bacteroidota bacterium]
MKIAAQNVPYVNIGIQFDPIRDEIMAEVEAVLSSGMYILGEKVTEFENSFAEYCGTKYAIGVANGTDSLILTMKGWGIGPGDEVIIPPNSFLASASSVALIGATPVFADVREDYNIDPEKIKAAITPKTKAIMPVHLTGRSADMDAVNEIAKAYGLKVLEDSAQAVGAIYKGKKTGNLGDAGSFSLHPLKNLNAAGDGGMITTNDDELYDYLQKARNHGLRNRDECEMWSLNSRLDALQAAILSVKLKHLPAWTERRRAIAAMYQENLSDLVWVPTDKDYEEAVYHTFIIQTDHRDELQAYLGEHNIGAKVHYPMPIHYQDAAAYLGYKKGDFPVTEKQAEHILSLPVYPELTDDQVMYTIETIRNFFANKK